MEFIRILYVLHLYLLSWIIFALVLRLYLLEHGGGLFSFTNGAHEIFFLSFVLGSFQVLGKDLMDYGTRSGKSLSFGMPKAPQGKIQGHQKA